MTRRLWWGLGGSLGSIASITLGASLDGTRGTIAALTVLALFFTVGGLLWGAGELRSEHRRLAWEMRGLDIILRSQVPDDEKRGLMDQVRTMESTMHDLSYLRELIRLYILEQAMGSLKAPLLLTLLGVVLGSGASVWSLWL
ncbi:hypothetical protein AB8A21_09600 [Streptomyces sp. BF23-18]|uniref:hypothetical protein n=1 Tax=Streptomyces sp. BF23-18 TaxID=3240282 RepID=UPI0034E60599